MFLEVQFSRSTSSSRDVAYFPAVLAATIRHVVRCNQDRVHSKAKLFSNNDQWTETIIAAVKGRRWRSSENVTREMGFAKPTVVQGGLIREDKMHPQLLADPASVSWPSASAHAILRMVISTRCWWAVLRLWLRRFRFSWGDTWRGTFTQSFLRLSKTSWQDFMQLWQRSMPAY
jgi:hypothetical protein